MTISIYSLIGLIGFIDSVLDIKGYKYLGMIFFPTNDTNKIILRNFNKRMVHVAKFYAWLDVNVNTPLEVKLMVLDNCVFSAILYGVECWGDILHHKKAPRYRNESVEGDHEN